MKNFVGLTLFLIGSISIWPVAHDYSSESVELEKGSYKIEDALKVANTVPGVVVGSGPAGLAAALYMVRGGYYTVLFSGHQTGGQLTGSGAVENMLGFNRMPGKDIMELKRLHAENAGVIVVPQEIVSADLNTWPFKLETEDGEIIYALSLVIATGSSPRRLHVQGEEEHFGNGVSTCAICDALYYKGKDVVVVGGGDSAVESALQLAPHVHKVTVLNRSDKMRAAPMVRKHLDEYDNVDVLMNKKVCEVVGDGEEVAYIVVEDTLTGQQQKLDVNGLFLAIGHTPNTNVFAPFFKLEGGHIPLVGRTQKTAIPGVFVAGEVSAGFESYRQAIIAEGDGAKAGLDAVAFLHTIGLNDKLKKELSLFEYHEEIDEFQDDQ